MDILQWKVLQAIPETRDATTYVLGSEFSANYEAGQFLTFLFDHHGQEVRRSFSIASTPGVDDTIAITVKKKINGEYSRFILENWKPGSTVFSLPASGRFTIDLKNDSPPNIIFLAAGSGIVPVYSLIKKVLHLTNGIHATLIYQNHDEDSIIYKQPLQALLQQYPERFHQIDLISDPRHSSTLPQRLNNGLLETIMNRLLTSVYKDPSGNQTSSSLLFYTCGPAAFMRMVQFTLRVMGFREDQLRKENFTIEYIPVPFFHLDATPRQVIVHYTERTWEYSSTYPTSILQSALNSGIELPYSCKAGVCSTCVAKCLRGSVKMSINEVLTEKDLAEGLVLTCVGYAETDVELRF
jgi:ring-1,2-phenylacetyl-CoA epoxidase subunit PaaE